MRAHDHEPDDTGLTPHCPGCEYLAEHPGEIDDGMLRRIWTADWHELGFLDKQVREALTRAVTLAGLLSNAFQYEHYNVRTGDGKLESALTNGQLMQKRGFE